VPSPPIRGLPVALLLVLASACGATAEPTQTSTPAAAAVDPGPREQPPDPGPPDDEPRATPAGTSQVDKTALARGVFEAVRAHDFERYGRYILTREDLAAAMPHLSREQLDETSQRVVGIQRMTFEEAYAAGEHGGIVWAEATFREAQQNGSESRPNIFIVFESAGELWSMKMDDCVQTARGWVVGDYLATPQRGDSQREPVD